MPLVFSVTAALAYPVYLCTEHRMEGDESNGENKGNYH